MMVSFKTSVGQSTSNQPMGVTWALLHKNLEKNQTQVKIKRKIKRNLRSIINRVAQNN